MRELIVNADDFGFTPDVNQGIVRAHREGILTATTLMAPAAAFDHAVRLAQETPTLDIGVHGVLVGDPPFPRTVAQLMRAVVLGQLSPYRHLHSQVRKIVDAGIQPSHIDTHKHTHLFPPVLDALLRVAREFDIPWVRKPFDLALPYQGVPANKQRTNRVVGFMRGHFDRKLAKYGRSATDHFMGFQITGRYDAAHLVSLIRALPEGVTEFMVHPGMLGADLAAARTRLKQSRADELAALTSPDVLAALRDSGVRTRTFR